MRERSGRLPLLPQPAGLVLVYSFGSLLLLCRFFREISGLRIKATTSPIKRAVGSRSRKSPAASSFVFKGGLQPLERWSKGHSTQPQSQF
jgi:hypothetical protein